jgi:hypothetical protein
MVDCNTDYTDELGCPCDASDFVCANAVCVPASYACDGYNDCGDYSDEADCSSSCGVGYWACDDGECIYDTWVCDGMDDCAGGEDEIGCK